MQWNKKEVLTETEATKGKYRFHFHILRLHQMQHTEINLD